MTLVQLSIPKPCAESWAAMTPTGPGRHCAACAKTVVDFTQLSDAEILEQLARAGRGGTCGRIPREQLQRPLQPVALAPPVRWRAWLAATVAVWGLRESLGTAAKAQSRTEQRANTGDVSDQLQLKHKDDYEGLRFTQFVLEGTVTIDGGKEALPGTTVRLKNTMIGTAADMAGHYSLVIPAEYAAQPVEVEFLSVGYERASRELGQPQGGIVQCNVDLKEDMTMMGEVVIIERHRVLPPAPWHPRRFYSWGKYWATRPFRRY